MSVTLRPVIDSDLPILYEQQLDPEATAMAAFPSRDEKAFYDHWAKIRADESTILRTIQFEDRIAGSLVSWEHDGEREIGYWLGKEYWGKGITTQALNQFLEVVTTRPLVAQVARHNIGSRRVLEKCGFRFDREDKFTDRNGDEVKGFIFKLGTA